MPRTRRFLPLLPPLLLAAAAIGCGPTAGLIPGEATGEPAPTAAPPPTAPAVTATAAPVLPPLSLEWIAADTAAPETGNGDGDGTHGGNGANGGGGNGGEETGGAAEADAALARSVVQIVAADETRDPPVAVRDGSGVVIDAERGLILTSAHVVAPFGADGARRYNAIRVGTTAEPGGEPQPTHRAVIAALDPVSELAVLRVTERTGGAGGAAFGLPEAAPGDAAVIGRGDVLRILGHPGLDPSGAATSQAIAITETRVTGTRGHPSIGDRAWLKTEGPLLPHGVAGGPAFNSAGELVGIAAQIAYGAAAPVAHVRPLGLAAAVLAEARAADPAATWRPPLYRPGAAPGTGAAPVGDGIAVSEPLFARQALEESDRRDLLEYARSFGPQPPELHYEFVAQGVPDGARVQEFWYLNGVIQEQFSAEYDWTYGSFRLVSDRIASANPDMGLPSGVWTVEIWIDGAQRAAGRAFVGVPAPGRPAFDQLRFGSALSPIEIDRDGPPEPGAPRLLAFFSYSGAAGVERLRWAFYRGGEEVYRSPSVPWRGGASGVWWVGIPLDDGLEEGAWWVEVLADGALAVSGGFAGY